MRGRIQLLSQHKLGLADIQNVIEQMRPLDGAREFLDALGRRTQVVILSDTYYEFAAPLMRQLGYPTLFCHQLVVDRRGPGRQLPAAAARPQARFGRGVPLAQLHTIAAGDSYNDTAMLARRTPESCSGRRRTSSTSSRTSR
jgi:phosphoserine/homoserine phosphotransferase